MTRNAALHIYDILQTIERVQVLTSGKAFADFQGDWALSFAVQRAIEIISEASRRLPEELKVAHLEIHWRRVAGVGNVLRHEYQSISDKVIWDVVQEELPAVRAAVVSMANTLEK